MSDYLCRLCGTTAQREFKQLHVSLDRWLLKMILAEHPEWKKTDGACPRCIEELRKRAKDAEEMEFFPAQ